MSQQAARSNVTWVLSLDSLRALDLKARTSTWVSGSRPPGDREAGPHPRPFVVVAPWPPVPGCPLSLIWKKESDRLRMTVTAPTVAAWSGSPDVGWTSFGRTVSHHDIPKLRAVTNEAAHALGVALGGPAGDNCPTATFSAKGPEVYAGDDLLAHAATDEVAQAAVAALNAHRAAAVLGAGIAVAADPACGAYRCDAGWLLAKDARPWTERAQEALALVGCQASARGTEVDATLDCLYRGVELSVRWRAGTATLRIPGAVGPIAVVTMDGPIAGVSHGLRLIDALPDAALLEIALNRVDD